MIVENAITTQERFVIENVFAGIPIAKLFNIFTEIRRRIPSDPSLIKQKKAEIVTEADIKVQQVLLEYFQQSEMADKVVAIAEEASELLDNSLHSDKPYILLIDPLDGTSAYCKGEETWGVMVGLCDQTGKLRYSWNLVSDGTIYKGWVDDNEQQSARISFTTALSRSRNLKIDVYDYGAGASEKFPDEWKKATGSNVEVTSYPAAVWAGYELYIGKLDGLLWLPSTEGKQVYPSYDLVMLGALKSIGYEIIIGKNTRGENAMIAIGPTRADTEQLYSVGLQMIGPSASDKLQPNYSLQVL